MAPVSPSHSPAAPLGIDFPSSTVKKAKKTSLTDRNWYFWPASEEEGEEEMLKMQIP